MTGRKETLIPELEDWTCPKWLATFTKAELQYLAAQQHDRMQHLQIQLRTLRTHQPNHTEEAPLGPEA